MNFTARDFHLLQTLLTKMFTVSKIETPCTQCKFFSDQCEKYGHVPVEFITQGCGEFEFDPDAIPL